MRRTLLCLALLAALAPSPATAGDPAADLKDANVKVRLAAVETLRTDRASAAVQLIAALGDADWEVVEKAAAALAERNGDLQGSDSAAAADALARIAIENPSRRVRILAAQALAKFPGWASAVDTFTRVKTDDLARALASTAAVADTREGEALTKFVERGLGLKKDAPARAAAARAIGAFGVADRVSRLETLSADPDVAVAAAAVEAVRAKPDPATLAVLLTVLARPKVPETVARRARAAVVEAAGHSEAVVADVATALKAASSPEAQWQFARVLGEIGELPPEKVARGRLMDSLGPALDAATPKARASAAWALGRIGGDDAAKRAMAMASGDTDAHVRHAALQSAGRLRTADDGALFQVLTGRLGDDTDTLVREEAAVQLGRRGLAGAFPTLRKAVEAAIDNPKATDWTIAVSALVSLGKTRSPDGVDFLVETATKAKDWKIRAAALVGLGHVQDRRAMPVLIDALGWKEAVYRNVAFEFLRRAAPDAKLEAKQADWQAWWKKNGEGFRWVDNEEEIRKAQKYGYAPDLVGVYEGLDVVVLQSEDRIELLLEEMKVSHRITRSGQVTDAGLPSHAILFSNCMGKITPKDVEPIAWFVHAGGYLFGSCWALKETVEKVAPGAIRKFPLPGQVLQNPCAEPCRPGSPFVDGVFRPFVQPVYILWGSYLIDVLDPERAEVLMDSPETEAKFGNGNLCAWFPAGHGLVMDSTNHFELQGYGRAENAEKPEERMAYALDHLGLTYEEIRKVSPGGWKNAKDADKEAKDLSCFRFLTNFVRQKRKSQE